MTEAGAKPVDLHMDADMNITATEPIDPFDNQFNPRMRKLDHQREILAGFVQRSMDNIYEAKGDLWHMMSDVVKVSNIRYCVYDRGHVELFKVSESASLAGALNGKVWTVNQSDQFKFLTVFES